MSEHQSMSVLRQKLAGFETGTSTLKDFKELCELINDEQDEIMKTMMVAYTESHLDGSMQDRERFLVNPQPNDPLLPLARTFAIEIKEDTPEESVVNVMNFAPTVHRLVTRGMYRGNEEFTELIKHEQFKELRAWYASAAGLNDQVFDVFLSQYYPHMEQLVVEAEMASFKSIRGLLESENLPELDALYMSNFVNPDSRNNDDEDLEGLVSHYQKLKVLDISGISFADPDGKEGLGMKRWTALCESGVFKGLTDLMMHATSLSSEHMQILFENGPYPEMDYLNIDHNNFQKDDLLRIFVAFPNLKNLSVICTDWSVHEDAAKVLVKQGLEKLWIRVADTPSEIRNQLSDKTLLNDADEDQEYDAYYYR